MNRLSALHQVHGRWMLAYLMMLPATAGISNLFMSHSLPDNLWESCTGPGGIIALIGEMPGGPEFDSACEDRTYCVGDPGVTLPDNNQSIIGEGTPGSTRCSAHLALDMPVTLTCGDSVRYEVWVFPFDGPDSVLLMPMSILAANTAGSALLTFDTRLSPDPDIRAGGLPLTEGECGARHRLVWVAADDCGETSRCESRVALVDCRPPAPGCIADTHTIVIPTALEVTLWASDFIAFSVDDCTPGDELLASFSATHYEPTRTTICHYIPEFDVVLPMPLWVADGGYDRNCDGEIDWHERNLDSCVLSLVYTGNTALCENWPMPFPVSGQVRTEKGEPVSNVTVSLEAQPGPWPAQVTGSDGLFGWVLPAGLPEVTIHAERNDHHKNGVSTIDLLRMQKHLLGIEPFTSPYQFVAADVNYSQSVSAIDLIELRKLILGLYTEFPANKSWRFFDAASVWPMLRQEINIPSVDTSYPDQDFIGVKIGDVNGSVQPNFQQVISRGQQNGVRFSAVDRVVRAGDQVELQVRAGDQMTLEGFQFTLDMTGLEWIAVTPGLIDVDDACLALFAHRMSMSWYQVGGVGISPGDLLFTLKFQATSGGQVREMLGMSSAITAAEAYDPSGEVFDLMLSYRPPDTPALGGMPQLYQNEPNPVRSDTRIRFWLPDAVAARLQFFDITGKVLHVREVAGRKGINEVQVAASELPDRGIVFYRLEAGTFSDTRAMILAE